MPTEILKLIKAILYMKSPQSCAAYTYDFPVYPVFGKFKR